MNGWRNSIALLLFYYIDFFYNLLYNYYRIKKRREVIFIMAIIGAILIFGIIYFGSEILFDIFFGGKK